MRRSQMRHGRATCNKADPHSPARCELAPRHDGKCESELNGTIVTWGADLVEPRRRGGGTSTAHTALSETFTDGVKAQAITHQLVEFGEVRCVRCSTVLAVLKVSDAAIGTDAYEDAIAHALKKAMTMSAKHHTKGRQAHGYRPDKYGNDFGRDLPFLIETPICHPCHTGPESDVHPGPQWSKEAV